MFETIIAFFKGVKFIHLANAMAAISPFIEHLEENYKEDKNAKNALIDTMIQVLQSHKEPPV